MADYKNGLDTKKQIINAAKKLFYEKGYEETTVSEICRLTGINQGSVYYHFKTKKNIKHTLAKIVGEDTIRKNYEEARQFTQDVYEVVLLGNFFFWYKFFSDDHYRKFSIMSFNETLHDDTVWYQELIFSFLHEESVKRNIEDHNENNDALNIIAAIGSDVMLVQYFAEHLEKYDYLYVAEYSMKLWSKIFSIDSKFFQLKIERIKRLLKLVNLNHLECML
ncbi:TetR/AcrR family transcriptional regulator [Eubacterium sp. AM05-23]|uniref:TetR/AcrR family transcriptional regulator n=1 Tax=Eubacterium TaxID=1730 RepID=UPI000E4D241B|nr:MULTISPECIES: TetR/AcrR family transcriptional regulator [Eubacterium]RHO61115.1 TetR/AcrR family transcriptional regulator [Eubacterium sp. AM05-23]